MVTYKTFNCGVRIDDETSYGAGGVEADALSIGKVKSISYTMVDNVIRGKGVGDGRNETVYSYGLVDVTGTMEWDVHWNMNNTIGSISVMKYAIGKIQGSGTTASPYEIYEVSEVGYTGETVPTFTMWVQNEAGTTDDVDKLVGCCPNNLTLSAELGGKLKASMDFVAQKPTSSTSITTAYVADTSSAIVFQQGSFKYGQTPSAVSKVQSFSLTLNNSLVIDRDFGSRFIVQPELGRLTYDFNITLRMTDTVATTFRDDFYGQANSFVDGDDSSSVEADNELWLTFQEGSASGDKVLIIKLDQVCLGQQVKTVPLDGGLVDVTYNGFAKQAKTGSNSKNSLITYYTTT